MKCVICGIELDTISEAIEQDWIPNFYEGEKEYGPACSSCADAMLSLGEDGEMEVKPEFQGKIQYAGGDYGSVHENMEEPVLELIMTAERKEQIH
jgi:hypothetical protein